MVKVLIGFVSFLLLSSGCSQIDDTTSNSTLAEHSKANDTLVRVQDYTGEGYTLRNSGNTNEIIQENKEEITEAVRKFFIVEYNTEVIVHNIVGAIDGATVFVESVEDPHFYTYAIVPIDVVEKKVLSQHVWSQEGQIENAIKTGLYAMIFQEEFSKFENYLKDIVNLYPITGITDEALRNVRATGYSTLYYYTSTMGESLNFLLDEYMKNEKTSISEWERLIKHNPYSPDSILFTVSLYMEDDVEPSEKILNQIVSDIDEMEGIPRGAYSIILNDNWINKTTAIGAKDNSLVHSYPNDIIKE